MTRTAAEWLTDHLSWIDWLLITARQNRWIELSRQSTTSRCFLAIRSIEGSWSSITAAASIRWSSDGRMDGWATWARTSFDVNLMPPSPPPSPPSTDEYLSIGWRDGWIEMSDNPFKLRPTDRCEMTAKQQKNICPQQLKWIFLSSKRWQIDKRRKIVECVQKIER